MRLLKTQDSLSTTQNYA